MRNPWNISDAEFVRRVDRTQSRWRRPIAVLLLALSAICIGFSIYFWRSVVVMNRGEELPGILEPSSFKIGLIIGIIGGFLAFVATFHLVFGLFLFFMGRKDRLLVEYHRRLVELGDLDQVTTKPKEERQKD